MRENERVRMFHAMIKLPRADLEHRLLEVQSAIDKLHPDAARFHFEREAIRRILAEEFE